MGIDFSKLGESMERGKEPVEVSCEMCRHKWTLTRREAEHTDSGVCPKCGAGRWESEGSKKLDALLNLEEGLTDWEVDFVESMSQQRTKARRDGYRGNWPSKKQVDTLVRIYERLL